MPPMSRFACEDLHDRLPDLLEEEPGTGPAREGGTGPLREGGTGPPREGDTALSADERARLLDHAASCKRCSELLESYRKLLSALADLPARKAPPGFARGVLARLEEEAAVGGPKEVRPEVLAASPRRFSTARLRAAAILLAGGLGIGLGLLGYQRWHQRAPSGVIVDG